MERKIINKIVFIHLVSALMVLCACFPVLAAIDGITGPTFNLTAKTGYISTAEGGSYLMWGYANGDGLMQYPGPTLIVNQGDTVTVTVTNTLTVPVSALFPGQSNVSAIGGVQGTITRRRRDGNVPLYRFPARNLYLLQRDQSRASDRNGPRGGADSPPDRLRRPHEQDCVQRSEQYVRR